MVVAKGQETNTGLPTPEPVTYNQLEGLIGGFNGLAERAYKVDVMTVGGLSEDGRSTLTYAGEVYRVEYSESSDNDSPEGTVPVRPDPEIRVFQVLSPETFDELAGTGLGVRPRDDGNGTLLISTIRS